MCSETNFDSDDEHRGLFWDGANCKGVHIVEIIQENHTDIEVEYIELIKIVLRFKFIIAF